MEFLKTHRVTILSMLLITISITGMVIIKQRLELNTINSNRDEFYFSLFQILFFSTFFYIIINWSFKKWKEYQLLKNDKLKAELVNLKNQISPHFFFNTLNNLYGLIKKDTDKAQDFVLKLSDLMRYSIYSSDSEKVSIKDELTYLNNYIDLHRIRYYQNIDFHFVQEIENEQARIYPLLLIILIENAFKHGVEKLLEHAYIHTYLKSDDQSILFTVVNNYAVIKEEKDTGLGLKNLRKRLDLLYGNKYNLITIKEKAVFKAELEIIL